MTEKKEEYIGVFGKFMEVLSDLKKNNLTDFTPTDFNFKPNEFKSTEDKKQYKNKFKKYKKKHFKSKNFAISIGPSVRTCSNCRKTSFLPIMVERKDNNMLPDFKLARFNASNAMNRESKYKKCSGCDVTYYCCKKCQRKHWNIHKTECFIIIPRCRNCNSTKKPLKRCVICKEALYCDKKCQTLHWKLHKKQCKKV